MLTLENIVWKLPDGETILDGINLTIPAGRMTVVTGPNGGGKTSLAKIIAGLETPTAGRLLLDGKDITGWMSHNVLVWASATLFNSRSASRD